MSGLDATVQLRTDPGRDVAQPKLVDAPPRVEDRLRDIGKIGSGGMGEVLRVHDRVLRRRLAMKVMLTPIKSDSVLRDRFLDEAQITAQLAHPGIPPVHEYGELEDGQLFFTMREVHGHTLRDLIHELRLTDGASTSEHALLEIFQKICECVAYAHARGVIHCDLKPANVMVGAFGEVTVMDWGVARLVPPVTSVLILEPPIELTSGRAWDLIAGTPAYMAPEQARGLRDQMGPATDVYALGVILYELFARTTPYNGNTRELLEQSESGSPKPMPERPGSIFDETLDAIVKKAIAPRPADRYAHAGELAKIVALWREGALRRDKALASVRRAEVEIPEISALAQRAAALRQRAERALRAMPADAPLDQKSAAWALEDQAAAIEGEAEIRCVGVKQLLQTALVHAPELVEAKRLLARIHFQQHEDATMRRAWAEAAQHEILLRSHDVGDYRDYLRATAPLRLATTVPCKAELLRFERKNRQLGLVPDRDLGETPLDVELPVGSYLVRLASLDGALRVDYPVALRRRESWDGESPVWIPPAGAIGAGEVYVPAGWFLAGGDPAASGSAPATRPWVEAFAIQRHPVTFRELAEFLADPAGAEYRQVVLRDTLDTWRPDWPAVGVSWQVAHAYACWLSARTNKEWRLPTLLEWEKAARGVDGRFFPWGDDGDPAFCRVRTADRLTSSPVSIHAYEADCSPYGMRGASGNVREWCSNEASGLSMGSAPARSSSDALELRAVKGGSWRQPIDAARVAATAYAPARAGAQDVGFRLCRSLVY